MANEGLAQQTMSYVWHRRPAQPRDTRHDTPARAKEKALFDALRVRPSPVCADAPTPASRHVVFVADGHTDAGRAWAVHHARAGADIAISYLHDHDAAERTAHAVAAAGGRCLLVLGDAADAAFLARAMTDIASKLGRPQTLVVAPRMGMSSVAGCDVVVQPAITQPANGDSYATASANTG